VTYTPISRGTADWDVPLNAELTKLDGSISALSLNVKDPQFGARGDGVTNDAPAIQAAINAAVSTGGPVFIPAGTYLISTPLSIPAIEGLIIQGTGWGSSLKLANGVNGYVMQFTGNDTRVVIRDLEIDGNHLQQTATSGGIDAHGAVACRFDNIHFTFCRDESLFLGGQNSSAFGHNNRVIGCLFDQTTGSAGAGRGIRMNSSDENQIEFCDFEFLGGAGANAAAIYDEAGTQFIVSCNFVNGGNNAKGVWVQNAKSTKIEASNFDGLSGDNIFIAGQKCVVTGNTLFSPGIAGTAGQASAIYLEFASSDNIVMSNTITSAPTNGVSRDAIREASDGGGGNNTIAHNRIITSGTWSFGPLDLSGTGSRVVFNEGGGTQGDNTTVFRDTLVVNVKDHGVKGDGTTDDTAAINATIAGMTTGGILYFPVGNYLLNGSSSINLAQSIILKGAGPGPTAIRIGAGFTAAQAISVSTNDCTIQDIQIRGNVTTTTSNPVADGVNATGVQTFKMFNTELQWINGYAVKAFGTAGQTLHGGQLDNIKIQSCAGGVYVKSDNTNTAANFQMSNIFTRFLGVTTGASANLDGIRIEDSWDVLCENVFAWMNATTGGTGVAFRVIGNCAATFVLNLDALGPQTGAANVSIEANANGSPQNVQITGGVIQQGNVGLNVGGAATQVRVASVRFINNQTHGAVISTTGPAIYLDSVFFSGNGNGAVGTNYDLNWSGTTTGFVTNCRFASPIVTVGTAGVQQSINITAAQNVRFFNADFQGTGAAQANWFTNLPAYAHTASITGGNSTFLTNVDFNYATGPGRVSIQPNAAGNNCLATNVQGSDTNDRFRLLGSGQIEIGPGNAARDVILSRSAANTLSLTTADFRIVTAGRGLRVPEGTNAKMGTATLVGGAATVSNTSVTATSRIYLTSQVDGGTPGFLRVSTRTAGTSFVITSSSGTDTSTVAYMLVEPS
jgi:hypothetical protein